MLKWFVICVFILVSVNCKILSANEISEDIYQALTGEDVILTSIDGMDLRASFLKNNGDKIVVSDVEGEIIVIEKSDIEHIIIDKGFNEKTPSRVFSEKTPFNVSVAEPLAPEQIRDRRMLLALQKKNYKNGRRQSRYGKLMIIPGWIMAGIGSFALLAGYGDNSNVTVEDESGDNSSALPFGWTLTGIGLPMAIIGHIVKGKGTRKLELAKQYELQAEGLSYEMKPFINPISDSYGVSFNITF